MTYRHLLTGGAKWLLAGAMLVGSATSAKAVILDGSGSPTPEDPNLKAWYRADFGVSTDAGGVTVWDDFSDLATGTARDLFPTAVDGAHQPTLVASDPIFGGMPSVSFDGVQNVLARATGNSPVSGNSDRTVIAVVSNQYRLGGNGIEHALHFGNSAGDQAYGILVNRQSVPTFSNHYWGGFDPGNAGSGYSPNIVTFNYDNDFYASEGRAGADRFWVNGINGGTIDIQATSTATGAPAHELKTGTQQFAVGSRIALGGGVDPVEHMRGNIAEIIIYDTTLSDSERAAVESYLGNKYGVAIGPQPAIPGPFSINAGNFNTAVNSLTFNGGTARPATDPIDSAPVVRVTEAIGNQSGTVWLRNPVQFASDYSFNTQFEMRATNGNADEGCCGDAPGADGLTFLIQQDPRGAEAIGQGGGAMGYVGGVVGGQNTLLVERSIGVELDTWHTGSFDLPSNGGTNGNHIGLNVSTARYTVEQSGPGAIPQITTGDPRNVWVDYDGKTRTMDVYISDTNVKPGSPTFTQKIDLSQVFSSNELTVGFAAGTGGAWNNYDIRSWDFDSQESASAAAPVAPTEFDFPSFGGFDPFFTFNGSGTAGVVGDRLRITDNVNSQGNSAIFSEAITLNSNFRFHTKFSFEVSLPAGGAGGEGVNGPGADGMTFVIATGPNGPAIVGGGGGALGLDGISANFVAVELDTWGGGSFDGGIAAGVEHIGVDASNTTLVGPASYGTAAVPRFNDGGEHFVWIDYFGETKEMKVYLSDVDAKPAMPTLTVPIDVASILGYLNEDVYMGFTAGTGGANNRHEVLSWSLAAVPEPSTYALLSIGVAGLFFARRRRK